jgi:hypothetical protein
MVGGVARGASEGSTITSSLQQVPGRETRRVAYIEPAGTEAGGGAGTHTHARARAHSELSLAMLGPDKVDSVEHSRILVFRKDNTRHTFAARCQA